MNPPMQYSKTGLALTESFEGCKLTSYWDNIGHVWTIGFGSTGPDIVRGLTWTLGQCIDRLMTHMQGCVEAVNNLVRVPLSQGQFDAIVDFAYNAGIGALAHSTLLRDLNADDFAAAADEFEKWDRAGGLVVAGLLRRRQAEEKEFAG